VKKTITAWRGAKPNTTISFMQELSQFIMDAKVSADFRTRTRGGGRTPNVRFKSRHHHAMASKLGGFLSRRRFALRQLIRSCCLTRVGTIATNRQSCFIISTRKQDSRVKMNHHHYSKQSSSSSSLTRCGVSSLSLSGLSISSDASSNCSSNAHGSTTGTSTMSSSSSNSGGMQRCANSTLRRGWGSAACTNLSALALYEEEQAHQTASSYQDTSSSPMAPSCPPSWERSVMIGEDENHHHHHQYHHHLQHQLTTASSSSRRTSSMDTTGDDWGYFVDGTLPSSVPIVW
jgi:hypothetical protein